MKRSVPVVLVAVGLVLLFGSYVWYTRSVGGELQANAANTSRMYARIYGTLSDPSGPGAEVALLDLSREIRELGVPIVVTDAAGKAAAAANTPFDSVVADSRGRDALATDPAFSAYVAELDRQNAPAGQPGIATVHFGDTRFVRRMRVIPMVQFAVLAVLLLSGVAIIRTRSRADREHVWAGMARESAHQLGTPLSSLHGWLELLGESGGDPIVAQALPHMQGDIERLERVSHRFERIGRPPRADPVDISEVATHVADYFSARLPTLANPITLSVERADGPLRIAGDRVLLEWALESLVKNAIDALAGQGGTIAVRVEPLPGNRVRVRVADDGPGIPRELRGKIFSAGFTTKERGWGIGLALTRRIIEENHGGKLQLAPSDRGAVFDIILTG